MGEIFVGNLRILHPDSVCHSIFDEIVNRKVYDKYKNITEGMTIIDVGAHIGLFTVYAALRVGLFGKVYAVEPNPYMLSYLLENTSTFPQVTVIECAVSKTEGETTLFLHPRNSGGASLVRRPRSRYIRVFTKRLDSLISEWNIAQIDFLKVDVEGAELEVLQSLGTEIDKVSYLSIAAYHYGGESKIITKFLQQRGMAFTCEANFVYGLRRGERF
jgi:FkbM family methyltransferase